MPVFCLVFHQWREDRLWGSEDGHREVRNHQSHKLVKHCSLLRATPLRVVLELESINSKNAVLAQLQSQCKPGCGMFLAVGVEDQVICLWTIRLFTYNHFSLELEKIHEHVHANVHKGVQAKPCWQDSYPSHWDAGMRQCEKEIIMSVCLSVWLFVCLTAHVLFFSHTNQEPWKPTKDCVIGNIYRTPSGRRIWRTSRKDKSSTFGIQSMAS